MLKLSFEQLRNILWRTRVECNKWFPETMVSESLKLTFNLLTAF